MRISIIILGLLAITAVYGYDQKECLKYKKIKEDCKRENGCLLEALRCSFKNYGILNPDGGYNMKADIQVLKNVIPNEENFKKAQHLVEACSKNVCNETGVNLTTAMIYCCFGGGIMKLSDFTCPS